MTLPMHYVERTAKVHMEQKTAKDVLTLLVEPVISIDILLRIIDEDENSMGHLQISSNKWYAL